MKKERIHPVLYLIGLCNIFSGLIFPFVLVESSIPMLIIFLVISVPGIVIEYGHTYGEHKKEKEEQLDRLRKNNTFFKYCLPIYRLGLLSYFPMMLSKLYAGG